MDSNKAPGQLAFEGHGGLACAWDSLLPSERTRWHGAELAAQEPLRQRAERAERELAASGDEGDELEDDGIALRVENAKLRARIAELEDQVRADALTHHDGMTKDQNRIRELEAHIAEFEASRELGAVRIGTTAARLPLAHHVLSQLTREPCAGDDPEGVTEAARLGRL